MRWLRESIMRREYFIILLIMFCGLSIVFVTNYSIIKGTIFSDYIEFEVVGGEIKKSLTRIQRGKGSSYKKYSIEYEYVVNGVIYHSDVVTFSSKKNGEEYVKKYPVGKIVSVYYQKSSPSFSVLEPNIREPLILIIPFFWLLLLYALITIKRDRLSFPQ